VRVAGCHTHYVYNNNVRRKRRNADTGWKSFGENGYFITPKNAHSDDTHPSSVGLTFLRVPPQRNNHKKKLRRKPNQKKNSFDDRSSNALTVTWFLHSPNGGTKTQPSRHILTPSPTSEQFVCDSQININSSSMKQKKVPGDANEWLFFVRSSRRLLIFISRRINIKTFFVFFLAPSTSHTGIFYADLHKEQVYLFASATCFHQQRCAAKIHKYCY
jgi:hypothetical protein